jgi:hypothetical protein
MELHLLGTMPSKDASAASLGGSATGPPHTASIAAGTHAELGLPVADNTRLRFLKRTIARVGRLVTHRQAAYNKALITVVDSSVAYLSAELERQAQEIAELRIDDNISMLRTDLHRVQQAVVDTQAHNGALIEGLVRANNRLSELDRLVADLVEITSELTNRIDEINSRP